MGRAAELLLEQRSDNGEDNHDMIEGWEYNAQRMSRMRDRLLSNLVQGLKDLDSNGKRCIRVNGPLDAKQRLPNTLSVGLKGVPSGRLLASIGDAVACSAGSACHSSSSVNASYSSILKSMNVMPEYAIGTLRLSVGLETTENDVDFASEVIVKEARKYLKEATLNNAVMDC